MIEFIYLAAFVLTITLGLETFKWFSMSPRSREGVVRFSRRSGIGEIDSSGKTLCVFLRPGDPGCPPHCSFGMTVWEGDVWSKKTKRWTVFCPQCDTENFIPNGRGCMLCGYKSS